MPAGFRSLLGRNGPRLRTFASYYDLAYRTANVETQTYVDRVVAAGGAFSAWQVAHAANLSRALVPFTKLKYLGPCLGTGIACHRVPLRDSLNVGAATNSGFVDADATAAGGLANATGAAKYLNLGFKMSQLGTSNNGGLGWIELNWGNGSAVEPIGCHNASGSERYVLDLRPGSINYRHGATSNAATQAVTAGNHRYYGQRSSATLRALYVDGAHVGTDSTTSDAASNASEAFVYAMGVDAAPIEYWKGASGAFFATSGDLTTTEIGDLDGLLNVYLKTLMGR